MKKLLTNTPAKITATLLSYIMVLIFIFSSCMTLLMINYQFYFSDEKTVKSEILTDMAAKEASYICSRLYNGEDLKGYYKNKNIYYEIIERNSKEVLDSNFQGQVYIANSTSEYTEYDEVISEVADGVTHWTSIEKYTADVNVYIAENMTHNDIFSLVAKIVTIGYKLQYFMIVIAFASCVLSVVLISFLFCACGHTSEGIRLNYLDLLPLDFYICICALIALFNAVIISETSYNIVPSIAVILTIATVDYFIALGFLLSCATRVKTGTLLKNTIIYRILRGIKKTFKKPIEYLRFTISNFSLIKKTIILIVMIIALELLFMVWTQDMIRHYGGDLVIFAVTVISLIVFAVILYFSVIIQKIKEGGEEISKGNLEHKINTKYMLGDLKKLAEDINCVNNSLQAAVEDRMKSERFKVELITNVSHDLKTPLTSIINYIDLIKNVETHNGKIEEYTKVLERQANRLKKLVEDLVEASKASTGNLSVNLEKCNLRVLLTQALGEFEDKLAKNGLRSVVRYNTDETVVLADARHLWRVFDNLLNNACKYSLEGTRVYIDINSNSTETVITFRNISKYELNINARELTERFVRGDKSRNTEGHGLGLSIATSLLEIQGADLKISVDGDLFKADIIFNK